MKLTKTLIITKTELSEIDTLEIDGGLWLVPEWIDNQPSKGFSKPVRMIKVPLIGLQKAPEKAESEYLIQNPIPKCVLDGQNEPEPSVQYEIRHLPDVYVELQSEKTSH